MTSVRRTAPAILAALLLAVGMAEAAPSSADKCATSKLKAAQKKATSKLSCYTAALKKSVPVDPDCLTKAEEKFVAAFAKAEAEGGWGTTGDAALVEGHVDDCVSQLVSDAPPACVGSGQDCSTLPCCPGLTELACQGGIVLRQRRLPVDSAAAQLRP